MHDANAPPTTRVWLAAVLLALWSCGAFAQSDSAAPALQSGADAYVIDELLVGVHEDASLDSPILKVIPSGSKLEILEIRDELVQVRTDDSIVGWVDRSYLSAAVPARLQLAELLLAHNRARESQASMRAQIAALTAETNRNRSSQSAAPEADAGLTAQHRAAIAKLESAHAAESERQRIQIAKLGGELATLRTMDSKQAGSDKISVSQASTLAAAQAEIERLSQLLSRRTGEAARQPVANASRPDLRRLQTLAEENSRLKETVLQLSDQVSADTPGATGTGASGGLLENIDLERMLEQVPVLVSPLAWGLWQWAGLFVLALGMFVLGVAWHDARVRRRHGGFRL